MYVVVAEKKQFKLWLEEDSIERLTIAGKRFGRSSAQEVVEELIAVYLPTWMAVNDSMRRSIDYQMKLISNSEQVANVRQGIPVAPRSKTGGIRMKIENPKTEKVKRTKGGAN